MILFLDFDGVLHPDEVFLTRNGPVIRGEGELFMWVDLLETALLDYPNVKIVLSTSWVRQLGFSKAKKRLPSGLQARVIGSTWHSSMEKQMSELIWWDGATRHAQITRFLARSQMIRWVALDDDAIGWDVEHAEKLVLTNAATGISDPSTIARLKALLEAANE
ncbi:HAD domain-containing protein [Pseudomonas viridiflava]|uniref:HAD domain-containing protein n=1 Tax=Pseudomonas viridiflava TaxID=33069 RepID=UPI002EC9ECF9|nr:HAD domain-containing protein [Pseudomonas viridiflava]